MARVIGLVLMILASTGGPHGVAAQDATPAPGMAGVYMCEGKNPDGSPYKGIVEIVKFHDSFLVRWTLPDDVTVIGVGLESGGVLAVSYFGGAPGVIVYRAEGDRLLGQWTMGGTDGGVFSETLTRLKVQPKTPAVREPRDAPAAPKEPEPSVPTGGVRL
jgi:hypothetical protein